jgi:DNA invertase Pin-like site-specific DNA recombinase
VRVVISIVPNVGREDRAAPARLRHVSTDDRGQDPENQLRQLRAWCERMGHPVVREYVEHESGRRGTDYRRRLAAVFEGASRREFDLLLFWSLDRFSREGMAPTVMHLQRLASYGVSFHSFSEPHLSADNELVRDITLSIFASLAKLEAQRISERTKAGLERARAQGKTLGRPRLPVRVRERITELYRAGKSAYAISRELRVSYGTVHAQVKTLKA